MRIAVIGTGNVGSAISRAAKRTGHDVIVTGKEPDSTAALGESLGVATASSSVNAVEGADLVVLAVPFGAIEDLASEIASSVAEGSWSM